MIIDLYKSIFKQLLHKYPEVDPLELINLIKSSGHKYIKRTGTTGNYKYWYKLTNGKTIASPNKDKPTNKPRKIQVSMNYKSRSWNGDAFEYTYADGSTGFSPKQSKTALKAPQYDNVGTTDSKAHTMIDDTTYKPERRVLHVAIIKRMQNEKSIATGKPRAIIILGPSAVGKSATFEKMQNNDKFQLVDSDIAKDYLDQMNPNDPHVDPHKIANYYHKESADIGSALLRDSIKRNKNIVLPATFSNYEKSKAIIEKLKKAGYTIEIQKVYAPLEQSLASNEKRYKKSGRFVPASIIEGDYHKSLITIKKLKDSDLFDKYQELDRTKPEFAHFRDKKNSS